jgi:hypothetical protein
MPFNRLPFMREAWQHRSDIVAFDLKSPTPALRVLVWSDLAFIEGWARA